MNKEIFLSEYYMPDSDLPFSIGRFTEKGSELHWHHYSEIIYQLTGETMIRVGNEEYHSMPGEITIISAERIHATRKISKDHTLIVLQFSLSGLFPYRRGPFEYRNSFRYLFDNLDEYLHCRITEKDPQILNLITQAITEYENKGNGYEMLVQSYLMQLLTLLIRKEYLNYPKVTEGRAVAIEKVKDSITFIENNYGKNITLSDAADQSAISIYNFCRVFKKATDHTFVEYLNYVRLREAEKMLLTTKKSISTIAYDVGFSSVNYFNRVFKKRFDVPPFLYRKQGKK